VEPNVGRTRIYQPTNGHDVPYPPTQGLNHQSSKNVKSVKADSFDDDEGINPQWVSKPFARERIYSPENGHQNHYPNTQQNRF